MGVATGFHEVLAKQLTELQRRLTLEFQSAVQKLEADNLALRAENENLRAQLVAPSPPTTPFCLPNAPPPLSPAPDLNVASTEEAELCATASPRSTAMSIRGTVEQSEASAWPIWRRLNEDSCGGPSSAAQNKHECASMRDSEHSMLLVTTRRGWATCILHPNSLLVVAWTFIGILLLSYDAVLIPMTAGFDLDHVASLRNMDILVICYWAADLTRLFFTGYEDGSEGGVEMRRRKIAIHYCTTWLPLDLCIVGSDVVLTFAPDDATVVGDGGPTRAGKVVRAWRIIRVLRIVRIIKMARRLWKNTEHTVSIHYILAVKAIYVFVADLLVCHYMACYFCAIGRLRGDGESWITVKRLENAHIHEVYPVALNWALAQSGFSTSDIQAASALENLYTSLCGFLWMVVVCVTIGLFYTWMREGADESKCRVQEGNNLRKYLEQREVSRKLASQILRYFRFNFQPHEPRVMEAEIKFLRQMPSRFQIKLHKEVYITSLRQHPFFSILGTENEPALVAICHLALTEYRFKMGETVFKYNVEARGILHVTSGELDYHPRKAQLDCIHVQTGSWLCEAALWRRWRHRGHLIASTPCELLGVDAQKVHAIVEDRASEDGWDSLSMVRKHARKALSFYGALGNEPSLRLDTDNLMKVIPRVPCSPSSASARPSSPMSGHNLMVWEDQSTQALVRHTLAHIFSMKSTHSLK